MGSEIAPDDLAERIATIEVSSPADRLDIDQAVAAGRKRQWRHRLTIAAAFACAALAATAAFAVTGRTGRPGNTLAAPGGSGPSSLAPQGFGPGGSAAAARELAGRWVALQVDGRDMSSWRDRAGLPANVIFGAAGQADQWQVNFICGDTYEGSFTVEQSGAFAATTKPAVLMFCPNRTGPRVDLGGAIGSAKYATISGSSPRTLSLLDGDRKLVSSWREDTGIKDEAAVCRNALGPAAKAEGKFSTIDQMRRPPSAPNATGPDDGILSAVPSGTVVVYCRTSESGSLVRYAVTEDGQKGRLP